MDGEAIARELGVVYEGVQKEIGLQFTDPVTGSTFYGWNLKEARRSYKALQERFKGHKKTEFQRVITAPLRAAVKDYQRIRDSLR